MKKSKAIYAAIAIVLIAGISVGGYTLSNKKKAGNDGAQVQKNNQNTPTVQPTEATESPADKFGPNETKLTDATVGDFIKNNKLVLVDFYLSTCPHCQKAAPILTEFSDAYKDKVKVGKIEVRENPKVADTYQIDSVPQFFLFKDGQKVDSVSGSNVTVDTFKAMIDKASK